MVWLGIAIIIAGSLISSAIGKTEQEKESYDWIGKLKFKEFIKENQLPEAFGIAKQDAPFLLTSYPDVPHLKLNGVTYYPYEKLKNYFNAINESQINLADELEDFRRNGKLLKLDEVQEYLGLAKEDANQLVKEYPDIPHFLINGTTYYPAQKLRLYLNEKSNDFCACLQG